MIVFENAGDLDLRALRTFGLSSKAGSDKIGRFGTGLKYATAVIVRAGGTVHFWDGTRYLSTSTVETEFRGQPVKEILLDGEPLPFTTDLGRDWEVWQAFRELYSNALDEGGTVNHAETLSDPEAGNTAISVDLPGFEAIYYTMEEHFIGVDETPLWSDGALEVYPGRSSFVFYRGIAVMKLKEPAAQRYNIKGYLDLTEDRTAKYDWQVRNALVGALIGCDHEAVVQAVCDGRNKFEATLDLSDTGKTPSAQFLGAATKLGASCNPTALAVVRAQLPADGSTATILQKGAPGAECLGVALKIARNAGADLSKAKFVLAEGVPMYTDFDVRGDAVFLSSRTFENQTKMNRAVFNGYSDVVGGDWLATRLIEIFSSEVSS